MVTELGMSDKVGPIHYAERQGSDFLGTELTSGKWHSEQTAREIDEEIERILKEAYETAARIVRENTEQMERITQALLTWETISGAEIKRILAGESLDSLRPTPPPQRPGAAAPTTNSAGTPAAAPGGRTQTGELPGTAGLSPA
jgi:cell division protease FtsH